MAKRKVTMLEAFEASAREARQRERSELRRNAADRRGVVGSLLSPFKGGEEPAAADEDAPPGATVGAERSSAGVGAVPIDRRPPGASSWEAPIVHSDEEASEQAVDDVGEEHPPEPEPEITAVSTVSAEAPAAERSPAPSGSDSFSVPMSPWSFATMVSLALAAVFAIGMGLGGVADDAPESQEGSSVQSAGLSVGLAVQPAGANSGPGPATFEEGLSGDAPALVQQPLSPAEEKFQNDEATKFTVMAITYDNSPGNVDLASDAYKLLISEGLPALRPYLWEDRIFVFVGGAESMGELDDALRRVKAIRDPRTGAAEFRSAYLVNTGDYRDAPR